METLPKILLNKYRLQIGVFLITVIVVGGGVLALIGNKSKPSEIEKVAGTVSSASESGEATASASPTPVIKIKVDVSGAVKNPGVYELLEDARVEDALDAAGGFSDRVDKDWVDKNLNLAARLHDGDKLYIPEMGETSSTLAPVSVPPTSAGVVSETGTPSGSGSLDCSRVNINTASAAALDECLAGIGPAYAQRIIEYRESHGGFKSIEELQEVRGIGPKTFEKIKDQTVVD